MAKKKDKRRVKKVLEKISPVNCPFCKAKMDPDYKDYNNLAKFVNDRARMLNKDRTGVCAKHQRRLSTAVKRARHLALLPFVPGASD